MALYYNKDSLELRELSDEYINELESNNNPKLHQWLPAPPKPSENSVWSSGQWVTPIPIVPQTISSRQVRIWLIRSGISLQQVENAINSMEDPVLREITRVEWEYAPYIERSHPMLVPLSALLGLTQTQLDQAFIEAQNI